LRYYWRIHLAVVIGSAVATSVLTGALLVGDSVRGSLKMLSLDRLGKIDFALVSSRFFREDLGEDLSGADGFVNEFSSVAPAILMSGSIQNAGTRTRASKVGIQGVDKAFISMYESEPRSERDRGLFLARGNSQRMPPVAINEALSAELGVSVGDPVVLSLERPTGIHREFLFGLDAPEDLTLNLRMVVSNVIPNTGMGRFGLQPHQSLRLNAFLPLSVLQKALGQRGYVNAILVSARSPEAGEDSLHRMLERVLTLEDIGLLIRELETSVSIESTSFLLKPAIARHVEDLASQHSVPVLPVLTYLANSLRIGEREIPYSTISAVGTSVLSKTYDGSFGAFRVKAGNEEAEFKQDGIVLNQWAADDLQANIGDTVTVSYYLVGPREELQTREAKFILQAVVAMEGLAADPGLTPDFPGIQNADRMSSWEAPFPVDLKRIRERDETYWETYRSTPKAFVGIGAGQQLWEGRFGSLSAMRIGTGPKMDVRSLARKLGLDLPKGMSVESVGLAFRPVKQEGVEASSGATDFSMLFIGFSQFLIVSAALLVGLLYRLGVEQRAGEAGILLASGFTIGRVRRRFLAEGAQLAVFGSAIGVLGALLYGWLMMVGLRTLWLSAVGTSNLDLHINGVSLVIGYLASVGVVMFAIWRTVRQLGKTPVHRLLSGASIWVSRGSGRVARITGLLSLVLAGGMVIFAGYSTDSSAAVGVFFGSGALLLTAGISFTSEWFRKRVWAGQGLGSVWRLGVRNSARLPGRSLLCTGLIACACFVVVAVGANRRTDSDSLVHSDVSGTGGFTLLAESDVPLHSDLNSESDRYDLGFSDKSSSLLEKSKFVQFRVLPGDDVSCLNLYRPESPRILGVPAEMIARGGFQFQQTLTESANPWELLNQELGPNVIPAIGDFNSVMWILQKGLGEDVEIRNEAGKVIKLRLVGLLSTSIFQGELLISEADFLEQFPGRSGYGFHLIDAPAGQAEDVAGMLERNLGEWGFDVSSTSRRLADFRAVENTYLSTFQTLGGLGLILGTIGLGIVLLRNALERKGELAVMQSFGFRRQTLSWMLLAENGFLLILGILIGTLSALLAVAPHLLAPGAAVPWTSLAWTLALVFLTGLTTSTLAAHLVLKTPLLPALKEDR